MEKLQFRVLYRQFLFRMVDLELLSAHAQGDVSKLLGQFASLLVFISVGLSIAGLGYGAVRAPAPALLLLAWGSEHFLIATTMLVVGLFAVLSWDSTFPDRRDVLVLSPLPVRPRTMFVAKAFSLAVALSLTVGTLHIFAGFIWPLSLAKRAAAVAVPSLAHDPAMPAVEVADLQSLLDRELPPGSSFTIAVSKHGARRIFATGGGEIRSTAENMLAELESRMTAPPKPGNRAWRFRSDVGTWWRTGAFYNPAGGYAAVVLLNQGPGNPDLLAEHIRERLAGEPALSLGSVTVPARGGIVGALRFLAVYWITMLAAGAFTFCSVLAVQGLAAQLPRQQFLRLSSFFQMSAFCLFVVVYFLQPSPDFSVTAPHRQQLYTFLPSYWFMGLFQLLNGSMHPALVPLAHRALLGLAVSVGGAAATFLLSYFRTLRKIVEEPDIVPGLRRLAWLPRFGSPPQTAIVQFAIRTLVRSRQHRVILAFYLGIGFAFTVFFLKSPEGQDQLGGVNQWNQVGAPLLASTIVMLGFAIGGMRVVFSMPLDMRANWIFRIAPMRAGAEIATARRRSLLALAVAPLWAASAVVSLSLWPWRPAAGHLVALALLGMILADVFTRGSQKIPFTCSYLPGKSNFHITFWFCIMLIFSIVALAARAELAALGSVGGYTVMLAVLAAGAVIARRLTAAEAKSESSDAIKFEEEPSTAVIQLGLT